MIRSRLKPARSSSRGLITAQREPRNLGEELRSPSWMVDRAKAGCQVVDMGTAPHKAFLAEGWDEAQFDLRVRPEAYNTGVAVGKLADWAEKNLPVKVYYRPLPCS